MSDPLSRSCFGHLADDIEQTVHQNVRTRADTKRPVATETASRTLVGRCGPHRPAEESPVILHWTHGQRVDGLRIPRLCKLSKFLRANALEFDHGPPERADESEGDLIVRMLTKQNPAALIHRKRRHIT